MTKAHLEHWPPGVPMALPAPTAACGSAWLRPQRRTRARPALVLGDETMSYAELVRQAECLAGWLQRRAGVARGDRVLLWSQNSLQFVVASYAILRADAVVVPVNAMWTADEVQHLVDDSGARVAIVASEFAPRLPRCRGLQHVVAIGDGDADDAHALGHRARRRRTPAPHLATPDDLAVLPYTSGTTGRPKGCMHTPCHRAEREPRGGRAGARQTERRSVPRRRADVPCARHAERHAPAADARRHRRAAAALEPRCGARADRAPSRHLLGRAADDAARLLLEPGAEARAGAKPEARARRQRARCPRRSRRRCARASASPTTRATA